MEKTRSEILSEIQETLAGLKARIAEVEERLAELERLPEEPEEQIGIIEEPDTVSPIDISIDEEEFGEPAVAPVPEPEPEPEPEPVPEPESKPKPEPETEPEPFGGLLDDEIPATPKASINDRQERRARKAVMDVMGQKLAWKTAIPGTPVKNIISAISLNDRVLFINTLFKEDPMAFQEAIAAFNGMASFEEAEEYVRTNHPEWNLNSDLVFRLMMAVRRKLK